VKKRRKASPSVLARSMVVSGECCAVIAVKARALGKTQLASQLVPAERVALIRMMLMRVIAATRGAASVSSTVVVSAERDTIPFSIPVLADRGAGLNEALTTARDSLRSGYIRWLVVLLADLPQLRSIDVDSLVSGARACGVAIAPDATGTGTNALCLNVGLPYRFCFGPGSRAAHAAEAERLGLAPRFVYRDGLAFDVDSPADLRRLWQQESQP
jgi:2-phospho-L-lactate/phosphoenolpyruvate guanylyltransferase